MTVTVYAVATALGRAAVAVVRISGPSARESLIALTPRLPPARAARLRSLRAVDGTLIDQALVLWFPAPASYTGEDCVELHLHGGVAVLARLHETLDGLGLRLAEPGEFTRRAFENGKLDLAQAEGIADLIEAETEAQRTQALAQLGGALGRAQQIWRSRLVEALAVLEAAVDFPDEEVPADVADQAAPVLTELISRIEAALGDADRGERVREGFSIALIGAPNAGKSTLLNALAGRDAAIVTPRPGTTRDVIEVSVLWGGYRVLLGDTAGLRETDDEIEAEGVRRAEAWAERADLRLWVLEGSSEGRSPLPRTLKAGDFCLINKADLPAGDETAHGLVQARARELNVYRFSAINSEDIAKLKTNLTGHLVDRLSGAGPPTATRLRHRELLSEAHTRLCAALAHRHAPELAAEDVRLAGRALDRITGRIDPEDVLDRVFSSFCIGK